MSDHTELIERLHTEADQCRNDGADDIARLLDAGVDALQRQAEEIQRLNEQRIELQTERAALLERLTKCGVEARRAERERMAPEIEALRSDAGRLDFLDQLSHRAATSDMHCSYGSVVLYVRTGIGSQPLAVGAGTARAAIDSAMQGVKG